MKWAKAPDELKALIDELMKAVDCQKRPMFGYPAFFINGNMFAGLFEDKLFLRLAPDRASSLKARFPEIASFEPMKGRPMKSYFVLPRALYTDAGQMGKVLQEAAVYCRSLPAKAAKPRKPRKA